MIQGLEDYIGAIGIQDNPTSGRFINDLPGITTNRIDQTYDQGDNSTALEGWKAIERSAIDLFKIKLLEFAKKYYLEYSHLSSQITGQYKASQPVTPTTEYKGILFSYDFYGWQNLAFIVESVNIYSEIAVNTTIYAFNAATGDVITSKDVSLSVGDNKVVTGWNFPVWRYPYIFIAYDAEAVQTIKQREYGIGWPIGYTSFKKVDKSEDILKDNLITDNDQGLITTFSVQCSIDNFVTQHLTYFQTPFMYCLASQALRESNHSEAINRFTLFDVQDTEGAEGLRAQYLSEFETQLQAALKGLKIKNDDYCFICNDGVSHRIMIP